MWRSVLPHSARAGIVAGCLSLSLPVPIIWAGQAPPVIQVTGATHVDVDEAAGLWQLRGDPVTVRRRAITVQAPDIRYDSRLQIVYASGGVAYADGITTVRTAEATVWLQEERAALTGEVDAVYRDEAAETHIRAARAELRSRERRAAVSGGVTLSRGDVTLSGSAAEYNHGERRGLVMGRAKLTTAEGTLTADRIDARLAADEFGAEGGVRLLLDDLEGTAQEVLLRRRVAVAVLSGGARLRTGRGELTATTVTADLDRRRFRASGRVRLLVYPDR